MAAHRPRSALPLDAQHSHAGGPRRASTRLLRAACTIIGAGALIVSAIACGDGGASDGSSGTAANGSAGSSGASGGGANGSATSGGAANGSTGSSGTSGAGAAGLSCSDVGRVFPMSADPDTGAVDISEYCLGLINGYRAKQALAPYTLKSTAPDAVCCQEAEAKTAAETGGHVNGGCGWQAQGFCGGGRNPNGTVQASVDWCPRLFFEEGPTGGHYQAMMDPKPRAIMCSYYAVSRDRHSVVVNYY